MPAKGLPKQGCTCEGGLSASGLLLGHSHPPTQASGDSGRQALPPVFCRHWFLVKPGRQELPVAAMPFTLWGFSLQETRPDPPCLAVTLWGQTFSNPVGELLHCIHQAALTCQLPC